VVVVLVLTLLGLTPALAHHSVFTIDVASSTGAYGLIGFLAINDRGHVLAVDFATNENYLLTNPLSVTPTRQAIACPQFPPDQTHGYSLNRLGDVVGRCNRVGFLRTAGGAYRLLDHPGAVETVAAGVNHLRQVVGFSLEGAYEGIYRGFRWQRGTFTPVSLPWPDVKHTYPMAINGVGDIVGFYSDTEQSEIFQFGRAHGFVIRNGEAMRIDVPGDDVVLTMLLDVNELGQALGQFLRETDLAATPFLWENGTFMAIPLPGTAQGNTQLHGLNRHGWVAGTHFLVDANAPPNNSSSRGILSIWSPEHATALPAPAPQASSLMATTSALRAANAASLVQEPSPTGLQAVCATRAAAGGLQGGKERALALLCGER
jgi:hypothetical protein